MSAITIPVTTLKCDHPDCGVYWQGEGTSRAVRRKAKRDGGWSQRVVDNMHVDWCTVCTRDADALAAGS